MSLAAEPVNFGSTISNVDRLSYEPAKPYVR